MSRIHRFDADPLSVRSCRWLVALVVLLVCGVPAQVAAQSGDASDYAIPGGQFFTEALPNRKDGAGFAVVDGHGADVWTAFQAAGGVDSLGYPVSRRFEWDGRVAQGFSKGILRWDPTTSTAQTLKVADLPGKQLPAYAVRADQPPRASAQVDPTPWSGWWWPAFDGLGPTLFAPNGPLDKYDRYVTAATGEDPGTRAWERQAIYYPGTPWAGHCNGFAAAALLEPEPTEPVSALGITFSVADLEGLLVDYHFGDAAAWSFGDQGILDPPDFQRKLLEWVGVTNKGFVLTFDMGDGEVWSYPVYRFESEWAPDRVEDGLWHVTTTVWMADMQVPADFSGTKPYPDDSGKVFTYDLHGDPRHPDDGVWTGASGRFAHPGRIWYPEANVRNADRDLVSPGLDRQTLANILSGSPRPATALTPRPRL
jgi:hypothetical protein